MNANSGKCYNHHNVQARQEAAAAAAASAALAQETTNLHNQEGTNKEEWLTHRSIMIWVLQSICWAICQKT